jgi:hypothetical protein
VSLTVNLLFGLPILATSRGITLADLMLCVNLLIGHNTSRVLKNSSPLGSTNQIASV